MDEIKIRNLDDNIVMQIDRMARVHHMSRNKYLQGILMNHVIAGEQKELEEKYRNLVNVVLEVVQYHTETVQIQQEEIRKYVDEVKQEIRQLRLIRGDIQ